MKKILGVLILLVVITPSVALASWWNPVSWFNNWGFIFNRKEEKTEVLEKRIKELETQLENPTKTEAQESGGLEVKKEEVEENSPVVSVPDSYYLEEQKRQQEQLQKEEEQRKITEQNRLDEEARKLNEVLEKQADEQEKQQELVKRNNELVAEYNEKINDIDKEILSLQKEYLDKYREMEKNPTGMSTVGLGASLNRLTQEYDYKIKDLEFEKQDLYYKYQEKISDLDL